MNILKNPYFNPQTCIYCQSLMEDGHESGFFTCINHDVVVAFLYQQDNELIYRMFFKKDSEFITQMMFNVRSNEFNLIKMPVLKQGGHDYLAKQTLVSLSFLPDVTPEQFDEYLEKLLNVQVFT